MYILEVLCALAVAILCADVEALVSKDVYIKGPVVKEDQKVFVVECGDSDCRVDSISIEYQGGLIMTAYHDSWHSILGFCFSLKPDVGKFRCGPKDLTPAKKFTIYLEPGGSNHISDTLVPSFKDAKLKVVLNNSDISITEVNGEGASVQKDPETGKNYVRIKSGFEEKKWYTNTKQVKVTCNGNCKGVQLFLKSVAEGNLRLGVSQGVPALIHREGCYNCLCTSERNSNCIDQEYEKFDLETDELYVSMIPDTRFTDAVVILRGGNIKSIKWYYTFNPYTSEDGVPVIVRPISGPVRRNQYVHYEAYCTFGKNCSDVRVEVKSDAPVTEIRVGTDTFVDASGNCPRCNCDSISSCAVTFQPDLVPCKYYTDFNCFYLTFKIVGPQDPLGYALIYGNNFRNVYTGPYPYNNKPSYP